MRLTIAERFEGCILGGAIGDAIGSAFENVKPNPQDTVYMFGEPKKMEPNWMLTDDTQLTLATIEALVEDEYAKPEIVAKYLLKAYEQRKILGIGASTLKAMQELQVGGHWSQVGRTGEYAAGNGAAMRVAPIAFVKEISNANVRDICSITHQNDEAYVGAICVVLAIQEILNSNWNGDGNLIKLIVGQIPDTSVRDRLIQIQDIDDLEEIGKIGNDGYVVNSVPLAIAAANQVTDIGIENMFSLLIAIGGDTDTNCSIAGQIAGALLGKDVLPQNLLQKLTELHDYQWIKGTIEKYIEKLANPRSSA